jgi:hypothetical protein
MPGGSGNTQMRAGLPNFGAMQGMAASGGSRAAGLPSIPGMAGGGPRARPVQPPGGGGGQLPRPPIYQGGGTPGPAPSGGGQQRGGGVVTPNTYQFGGSQQQQGGGPRARPVQPGVRVGQGGLPPADFQGYRGQMGPQGGTLGSNLVKGAADWAGGVMGGAVRGASRAIGNAANAVGNTMNQAANFANDAISGNINPLNRPGNRVQIVGGNGQGNAYGRGRGKSNAMSSAFGKSGLGGPETPSKPFVPPKPGTYAKPPINVINQGEKDAQGVRGPGGPVVKDDSASAEGPGLPNYMQSGYTPGVALNNPAADKAAEQGAWLKDYEARTNAAIPPEEGGSTGGEYGEAAFTGGVPTSGMTQNGVPVSGAGVGGQPQLSTSGPAGLGEAFDNTGLPPGQDFPDPYGPPTPITPGMDGGPIGGSGDALGEIPGNLPPQGGGDTPTGSTGNQSTGSTVSGQPPYPSGGGSNGLPPMPSGMGGVGGSGVSTSGGGGTTSSGSGSGGTGLNSPPWGSSGGPPPSYSGQDFDEPYGPWPYPPGPAPSPGGQQPPPYPQPGPAPSPGGGSPPPAPAPTPYPSPAPSPAQGGNTYIYQGPQNVGSQGYSNSQGENMSQNQSQSTSEQQATGQSTSSGTSTAQGTSTSTGRSGSDAKQTWELERLKELLGPYLGREAAAENPYSRDQFAREANRAKATIAAQGNRQLQDLMARSGSQGFDANSAAVLMGRQNILQGVGRQQLQATSAMDDKFRQKYGDYALQQAGQAITQRGQDVGQRGLDAGIANALLGQTKSFGQQDASSQNTSQSANQSQATNQSTGNSQSTSSGNSYGYNKAFSEWWPIISML